MLALIYLFDDTVEYLANYLCLNIFVKPIFLTYINLTCTVYTGKKGESQQNHTFLTNPQRGSGGSLGLLVFFKRRVTRNQYRVVLSDRLYPMIKHFCPDLSLLPGRQMPRSTQHKGSVNVM